PNPPFALAYHQPTNSMLLVSTSNGTTGIYRVQADGTELLYASLPGLSAADGTTLTTVQSDNTAGFTVGDIFMPTSSSNNGYGQAQILKVSNGGATVTNPW